MGLVNEERTDGGDATIRGRVLEEKDRALGGVKIACDGEETLTLFDGTYAFEHLNPGAHEVVATHEGYEAQVKRIEAQGGEITLVDFGLLPLRGEAEIY